MPPQSSPRNTADVIVVGAGGSGLAAAVSAAEHGCRVVVFEKESQPGGTTGIAVGSFTANRTSQQHSRGMVDTLQHHIEDAARFAPPAIEARNNAPLRASFLRHAADTLEWLGTMGLRFQGPNPEPPNRAPRMHNVIPNAKAYIAALQGRLMRLGGTIHCATRVQSLSRQGGRVTGVTVIPPSGVETHWIARRGVILAGGDYANSAELIARHKGPQFARIPGINPHATGEGHLLAESVGARLLNMDVTYGPEIRFMAPPNKPAFQQILPASGMAAKVAAALLPWLPNRWLNAYAKRLLVTWQHPETSLFDDGAILVNADGDRFCNECQSPDREIAIAEQPGSRAFILMDERLIRRYSQWPHFISTAPEIAYAYVADYQRLRPDISATATTLDALASRSSIDRSRLLATVSETNEARRQGAADLFGATDSSPPLEGRQWLLLGPAAAYFTTTEGGAAVNEHLQVLDRDDHVIPGLYAVGQNGLGGQVLWGHGLHIAWALTSGRLAGQSAAAQTPIDASANP